MGGPALLYVEVLLTIILCVRVSVTPLLRLLPDYSIRAEKHMVAGLVAGIYRVSP